MKLADIAPGFTAVRNSDLTSTIDREESHPEIAELLRSRGAMLMACQLVTEDERELVVHIANKLDASPSYVPSMIVLHLIRDVNAKLALCSRSKDAIC